eukprot:3794470-Rhodomonas_salina.1
MASLLWLASVGSRYCLPIILRNYYEISGTDILEYPSMPPVCNVRYRHTKSSYSLATRFPVLTKALLVPGHYRGSEDSTEGGSALEARRYLPTPPIRNSLAPATECPVLTVGIVVPGTLANKWQPRWFVLTGSQVVHFPFWHYPYCLCVCALFIRIAHRSGTSTALTSVHMSSISASVCFDFGFASLYMQVVYFESQKDANSGKQPKCIVKLVDIRETGL